MTDTTAIFSAAVRMLVIGGIVFTYAGDVAFPAVVAGVVSAGLFTWAGDGARQ